MSKSTGSEFVDFIIPLRRRLDLYDPKKPPTDQPRNDAVDPAKAIPQGFIDAMIVRQAVFVDEQGVPLENELDEDDPRSFHWTAYASVPAKHGNNDSGPDDEKMDEKRRKSTSTKLPIGTIRLVVPPHSPHPGGKNETDTHIAKESYVKLGRLAVIKEFRKTGIAKLLVDTAVRFVRDHPNELLPYYDPGMTESMRYSGVNLDFNGLILVHAQTGVQKVWKKYGFETDQSMGTWDEEGISHVGMWKKVDITEGRRKAKMMLPGSQESWRLDYDAPTV